MNASMAPVEASSRLKPYGFRILEESYERIAEAVRAAGARPAWVFVPRTEEDKGLEAVEQNAAEMEAILRGIAERNGFVTFTISDAFDSVENRESLFIATWDGHPNAQGHQLLGDRLYEELVAHGQALGMSPPAPSAPSAPAGSSSAP